jgi:hypothetical protein
MAHEHYFASSGMLSNILGCWKYLQEKRNTKRMVTGVDLMAGTKQNLTSTTPSAGVGLKISLFMELGPDYPFAFSFLSFTRGCGAVERE